MKKSQERAQKIEETIKILYDSLQSHLPWTYKSSSEGIAFHKKAIKDYSRAIKLITELY